LRGFIDQAAFEDVLQAITIELPALVNCRSGGDRAGFSSFCIGIFTGELLKNALDEMSCRSGHFKAVKMGVLDHFFGTYFSERDTRESLMRWIKRLFSKDSVEGGSCRLASAVGSLIG
jgi:protein tyrosine/serine phosphatase